MLTPRVRAALVALAASAGLGACTNLGPYGGIGVGVSSGYGYGSPYGYGYGSPYYGSYYGGYPYFGWYDGFYYPGAGYWVYDPIGHPHPITDRQRSYWSNMLKKFREARGTTATAEVKENWSGFRQKAKVSAPLAAGATASAQADERSLRQIAEARRQAQIERQQVRAEARQQARSERQESLRQQVMERREQRRARTKSDD